jgi:uncharacterized protein (TIGR03435 family)
MEMQRTALITALAACLPLLVNAQTKPTKLEFEVASIRPASQIDAQNASVKIGVHIDGSQIRFTSLSLRDCMRFAWGVKDYQIDGPAWVASDRWDIVAKLPSGSNTDQVPDMLQALLTDRFKLTFHHDSRDFAVLALVLSKGGLKLHETPRDPNAPPPSAKPNAINVNASGSAAGVFVDMGQGSSYSFADNKLVGKQLNMFRIADTLSRYMEKPVVDLTGLPDDKFYDFTFEISPDDYRTMLIRTALRNGITLPPGAEKLADMPTDTLAAAMEAAGLRLESRKAPQDVMVIEKADKTPTDN